MKYKRILIFTLFIVCSVIAILFGIKILTNSKNISFAIPSTVKIKTGLGEGSGVIIDKTPEDIVVVTALHTTYGWNENSRIIFGDGTSVLGQIFNADEKTDLCYISIMSNSISKDTFDYVTAVELSNSIEDGEDIFTVNIYSENMPLYKGHVESSETYLYDMDRVMMTALLDDKACEGMSGMGVFNNENELLGIIIAGNEDNLIVLSSVNDIIESLNGIMLIE